jgi:CDP-glucose 4,6-dehydratase
MKYFGDVYRGRRVLVTGHTGFKGSWLALWLKHLGAEVAGFSIDVPTNPSVFGLLALGERISHHQGDVRDRHRLAQVLDEFKPEMVFHLAAQALVRRSYADPVLTFETNVLGMLNVLEAVRARPSIQVAVLITSDKAYRNVEWTWGYREIDELGGHDPYSGSKSCADILAQSYYHSFLRHMATRVAIARAGNVIGGGDWAADRIVPDAIRAWSRNELVAVRSPRATRPWQHVLEPLSGYLWLGAELWRKREALNGEAFNFGPDAHVNETVAELLEAMAVRWPNVRWHVPEGYEQGASEATLLKLSCDKALTFLKWRAVLQFSETVAFTIDWYRTWHQGGHDLYGFTLGQIDAYCDLAAAKSLEWTKT